MPYVPSAIPLVHDFLEAAAADAPDRIALVCGDQRVTYAELQARSHALANALADAGVARGDRVVVFCDNGPETVIAFFAALAANAVASIVNPQTKRDKLRYVLRDCRPAALIADARLETVWGPAAQDLPSLRIVARVGNGPDAAGVVAWDDLLASTDATRAPPRRCLDVDLAAIVYTSGSTGDPKGVMLTHRNMTAAAASIVGYLGILPDDVILNVLPLAFDYGLYQVLMAVRQQARVVLERSFAFPAHVLRTAIAEQVTVLPGVPTMFATIAELRRVRELDLSRVRIVTNTAAALPIKHIHLLRDLFPTARIFSMYGLTECKRCTYLPPEDLARKPESVGIAIPNTELWIVDADDRRVGPNVVGQLVVRGATVMRGYWEKPEATAQKLRPGPLPGEVVLYTGDLCRLDDEGYLHFVARTDDVIKSRGEKVPPKEVENALVDVVGVKEAAVIGVPDDKLGQAIKAFVVLEAGATWDATQLLRECQSRLEPFMVPQQIRIVPALPKTDTGKIKKTELA